MDLSPLSILLLVLSLSLGFFVQTVIGFAAPLIALPILTRLLGLQAAVGLISIYLLLFSIVMTRRHWHEMDRRTVLELSGGGIVGIFIGVWVLQYGSPVVLNKLLGVFILFYVAHQFIGKAKVKQFQKFGWIFGLFAGLFSGLFSSGSPFYVTYIYNKLSQPNVIRATIIGSLGIGNTLRFALLTLNGTINAHIASLAFVVLPGFLLAVWLGQKAHSKLDDVAFKRIVMAFLVLSGISLVAF